MLKNYAILLQGFERLIKLFILYSLADFYVDYSHLLECELLTILAFYCVCAGWRE